MAYEKNTWASGDVVTSAKLNHMENGIEAASSPYDLVIVAATEGIDTIADIPSSAYHITHGSIEACEQKIANMEPVNVFLGWYESYSSELPNIVYPCKIPLNDFSVAYRYIDFGYAPRIMYTSGYEIDDVLWY